LIISPQNFLPVYVFVGEHFAMVDFVKCLQNRGLLKTGNYMVISVDDEIYDLSKRINIMERGEI
jgi:guanylate cyclase, other